MVALVLKGRRRIHWVRASRPHQTIWKARDGTNPFASQVLVAAVAVLLALTLELTNFARRHYRRSSPQLNHEAEEGVLVALKRLSIYDLIDKILSLPCGTVAKSSVETVD